MLLMIDRLKARFTATDSAVSGLRSLPKRITIYQFVRITNG
jgi:hypothetical protein